ncbi:LOW QUALITY PROTEIN: THAP domain-containing protein 9 [Plakobranchus ocellatus]|uniref:THAP domain-containing protein 9 n=1 Tax=Plakobranchus ocellatus TaxID=259542 RepID=A0AAV3ZG07_9GAST|nr:LOW QUALITY PROTEIN: THAP domain-containing protein 9 [Plakobranchus ocellatus]
MLLFHQFSLIIHHVCRKLHCPHGHHQEPRKRKLSVEETPESLDTDLDVGLKRIRLDHAYSFASPEERIKKLQEKIASLERSLQECRTENKSLKEKLKRRDAKCNNLIKELEDQKLISNEAANLLNLNFNNETLTLIQNELEASQTSSGQHRYSEAVKEFAITVHFYSPKAYDYLRGFLHLPSPSTIRRWATSIDCEPGFLSNVINKLGEDLEKNSDMKDVCIMFDAISIKKECLYDEKTCSLDV